ncbi:MAG: hypothetical protein MUE82_06140 [Chloroflexi bacterium]|jgi:uncharacterized membrane protein|nr:hypothetical protein [Chloroflexota bacterium]
MDPQGIFDQVMGITIASIVGSLVVTILITVLIVGVIVWAIRRSAPPREDPAIAELKGRLARGEIDPLEFRVRMDEIERQS